MFYTTAIIKAIGQTYNNLLTPEACADSEQGNAAKISEITKQVQVIGLQFMPDILNRVQGNWCLKSMHVVHLMNDLRNSCPQLYQVLTHYKNDKKVMTYYHQLDYPLVIPTLKGLLDCAEKYKTKYGISITVLNFNLNTETNESIQDSIQLFIQKHIEHKTEGHIGIMCSIDNQAHGVPLILEFSPTGINAICLDVAMTGRSRPWSLNGGPERPDHPFILCAGQALARMKIPLAICEDKRHSDGYSALLGAMVTLRNALLHLKHLKHTGKSASASTVFNEAKTYDEQGNSFQGIPPEWGFTDQLFTNRLPIDGLMNPRRFYSKKGKMPERITAHIDRWICPLTANCSLTLPKSRLTDNINLEELKIPAVSSNLTLNWLMNNIDLKKLKTPARINISHISKDSGGELTIRWKAIEQPYNGYLLHKGYKMAGLKIKDFRSS